MLIRCERCRAVYQLDVRAQAAVQCVRCQLVFAARPPASLGTQGTLGGAAAQAVAAAPQLTVVCPPRSRASAVWLAGLTLAIAAAALGLWRARSHRVQPVGPPPLALAKEAMGEELLWHDDKASLESAIAAFSDAESIDPTSDAAVAQRALATLLLGTSLREEEQDLTAELERLQIPIDETTPADVIATNAERVAEIRHALPPLSSRADAFIKEGLALTQRVQSPAGLLLPTVARTRLLADALQQKRSSPSTVAAEWTSAHPSEPAPDAWRAFVAGLARTAQNPQPADWVAAEADFDLAARVSPHFIRARWELARACLAATPPDPTRARAAVDAILQLNPRHEGAQRMLAALSKPPNSP